MNLLEIIEHFQSMVKTDGHDATYQWLMDVDCERDVRVLISGCFDKKGNRLSTEQDKRVLASLRKAGLCVCEASLIESHHPGLIDEVDLILTRIEESS